jgi:hypothetical protein
MDSTFFLKLALSFLIGSFLFKAWGLALGTSVSHMVCLGSGYLLYLYLKSRLN